ncbi:hypothetical protein [Faecalibacterium tardum]|jgi:hypothetical protein|uniref:Uncharacterized protein n=1 Tax=Faecalibacterium tardum TaxID=3133156 RepID=A0ABV1ATM0_9FIRM
MESENVVLCPVHKKILRLEIRKLEIVGSERDVVTGHCPICKKVYTGTLLKKCSKFMLDGTLYSSILDMDTFQNEEGKDALKLKIQQQNDRYEQEKNDEIRKKELENQRKEREQQEVRRKKQEEEQKKREKEKQREAKLAKKEEKLNAVMPKTIYVLRDLDYKECPVCNRKIAFNPVSLTLQSRKGKLKDATIMGYSCTRCHAVFVPQKLAEKEFLEQYIEYLNLDYLETKLQEIGRKEAKAQKDCEKYKAKFPFLESRKVEVNVERPARKRCPKHKNNMKLMGWLLTGKKTEQEQLLYGYYCIKCNTIYISEDEIEKASTIINNCGTKKDTLEILPAELKDKKLNPVEIVFSGSKGIKYSSLHIKTEKKNKPKWDDVTFKQVAYQKYEKEIAEIAATVADEDRLIRILTTVNENDKRKCVPEDMLIHESVSTGRELLGRIAHDQLGEFTSKYGIIKIHNYKVWPGQEHHLDGFTRFCDPENIQNITIMSQNNISRDSDEYEMVTALVYCANREEPVYIDVYYSKRQNKYFINEESYRQYRLRYGLPYVHLVADEYDGDMDYGNLRKNSELNLYGYTVAKTADMTTGERQRLLQQLMDNGLMSKHQIVNHLEWLIHRQSGRIKMEDACDCWREDLRFVNSYRLNAQRKIQGRFVYGKTVLR